MGSYKMKKTNKHLIKLICAIFTLALICAIPSFFNPQSVVKAAQNVGVFTFKLPESYLEEVNGTQIDLRLYKLANHNVNEGFTSLPQYASLNFESITADTTANELAVKASEAARFLDVSTWDDADSKNADKEISFIAGEEPELYVDYGLYLICIKDFKVGENVYESLPYLLSMPTYEEIPGQGTQTDDSPSVTLKITKSLPDNDYSDYETRITQDTSFSFSQVLTGDSILKLVIPCISIGLAALAIVVAILFKRKKI